MPKKLKSKVYKTAVGAVLLCGTEIWAFKAEQLWKLEAGSLPVPEKSLSSPENWLPNGSSLASQVHAAAVNGDKATLQKLIAGNPDLKDAEDQFGRTPLMYCVLADRLDCAEALLKAGADVNKADRSQRTALHLAAQKGNYRFLRLLVRRANSMQKDLEEMTPLHLVTRHKNPKCLAYLLKNTAPGEVDTQDKNKQTALHWSAYYNNPEHVKLLIKHDSNIGIPDIEGKIPLHWAASSNDPSAVHTVRCILEAAPTESLLNWQDYEGRTPLHFAVANGNEAVVSSLISYEGCNVTSYDNLFRTPLHWAAVLGHAQIVHLLLERNKSGTILSDSQGATPLHYAAQSNFADSVQVFLEHASVKDDPDLEGRTAFMWAAGKGSDDVIKTMLSLKSDIDINMSDKYGGSALHAAALAGHVSTVKLLLKHGAQVDGTDVMKHTPLFRACEMGHKEVIQTLIEGNARVDLVDQDGHSPLHWAALGGNADVCQILIENKINPNVQDYAGRTPLQCAAYGGYISCMAVLMENKADPNVQDKEGRTALHWSCNNGYLDAVKLLLGYGAFPNHMENSEERYTPLDYALLGEHHEVIQFMLEHGALTISAIQDIAAAKIQAVYKGYKVRKAFQERKNLLMKHEQLRKDAAKKREEGNKKKEAELQERKKVREADVKAQPYSACKSLTHTEIADNDQAIRWYEENNESPDDTKIKISDRTIDLPLACQSKQPIKNRPRSTDSRNGHSQSKKEPFCKSSRCKSASGFSDDRERPESKCCINSTPVEQASCLAYDLSDVVNSSEQPRGIDSQNASCRLVRAAQKRKDHHKTALSSSSVKNISLKPSSDIVSQCTPDGKSPTVCFSGISSNKVNKSNGTKSGHNHERPLPAGSSRPGSAKTVSNTDVSGGDTPVRSSTPDKSTHESLPPPPPSSECQASHSFFLSSPLLTAYTEHDISKEVGRTNTPRLASADARHLCSLPLQNSSIELIPLETRLQLVEKERMRKELFRKKNHAATVIQRTWKSYQLQKEMFLLRIQHDRGEDHEKWKRDMTLFCVQLAWKNYLKNSISSSIRSKSTKSASRSSSSKPSKQHSILRQIYGVSQEGRGHHVPPVASRNKLMSRESSSNNTSRKIHSSLNAAVGYRSYSQILHSLQGLSTEAHISNMQYVHLLENVGKSKKFSYNMQPGTAGKTKKNKSKDCARTEACITSDKV
ncbi:inversin [Protopterus annectens]|uniref:inversin n=1 Tax=Protopterus annectens TaxID=7888 RepID=UPI001CFA9347|nr:inversin [Protopterus annectens]